MQVHVHLQTVQVKFVHQRHPVKVKVTGATIQKPRVVRLRLKCYLVITSIIKQRNY